MLLSDFDYDLPEHFIAQTPIEPRDASRLMVLDRQTGAIEHRIFHDLPDLLTPQDVLVLNDTRVIPARLRAHKANGRRGRTAAAAPLERYASGRRWSAGATSCPACSSRWTTRP